ncbi:HutD family protein [uncultured Ferrovibrio sp.]|jgi:environmental stress-induced protein Ves|uniref:HutD/Ves family protein n=1 Tax=uncultured Ferrovibrio sp. TaxID=1576913 RepID=UPI002603B492|nr:HutD family protein [uncultured Ferrovibrio sp.]
MKGSRLIRLADIPPQPWKNGGGITYEIAADPPSNPETKAAFAGFRWRISRALIERDGPFSVFPGMTRWILLLDGEGFTLSFSDRAKLHVIRRHHPEQFPGAALAQCRLQAGPCSVLNVIAREDIALRVNVVTSHAPLPSLGHALISDHGVGIRLDERHVLNVALPLD